MHRTELRNGIAVVYSNDCRGKVIIQYPDGRQVSTNWAQLSKIESLVENLRQAYYELLVRASSDLDGPPVKTLLQIDDLLFEISSSASQSRHAAN